MKVSGRGERRLRKIAPFEGAISRDATGIPRAELRSAAEPPPDLLQKLKK
jgi:hypothetical protein